MIFPYGLEDSEVNRTPWASISIVMFTIFVFAVTLPDPGDEQRAERALGSIIEYAEVRPYLTFPERCAVFFPSEYWVGRGDEDTVLPSRVDREQTELDGMCHDLMDPLYSEGWRRWSLVPARGIVQAGWLSHIFLHAGGVHLLGNIFFFFFLVGPFLEDVWGRPLFVGFYLAGGLVAGIAQAVLDWGLWIPILGASGAIAACMGAFSVRFAKRRVRFIYWFFLVFRGTFGVPAWFYGIFWIGSELFSFLTIGEGAGIAFMAHIGGFIFGAGVAVAIRAFDIEARFITKALAERTGAWEQHPGIAEAIDAMAVGDREAARAIYDSVLVDDRANTDASLGLARLDFEEDEADRGTRRLDGVFSRWLAHKEKDLVLVTLDELSRKIDLTAFRPSLAWQLADLSEGSGRFNLAFALFEGVAQSSHAKAAAAGLEAAALAADRLDDPLTAHDLATRSLEQTENPVLTERAHALIESISARRAIALENRSGMVLDEQGWETPAEDVPHPESQSAETALSSGGAESLIRASVCKFVGRREDGMLLEKQDGRVGLLAWDRVKAIVAAVLDRYESEGGQQENVLLTDLVLDWGHGGQATEVLRVPVHHLNLLAVFPEEMDPGDARSVLMTLLLDRTNADAIPSRSAIIDGPAPRYHTLHDFETASYRILHSR